MAYLPNRRKAFRVPPYGPAPSGLGTTVTDWDKIDLDWTDNTTDEDGFKIERKPSGGSWGQIDTVGAGVTTYRDDTVARNVQYYYRVRAYKGALNSPYSNEATFVIPSTVKIRYLNILTGWSAEEISRTSDTLGSGLDKALATWGYDPSEWNLWVVSTLPGGSQLDQTKTFTALGLTSDNTQLYTWK